MRNICFVLFALLIIHSSCKQNKIAGGGSFTINGKIDDAVSGEMIVLRQQLVEAKPDTAYLAKDGSFTFKGEVTEPMFASIYFPGSVAEGQQQQAITFFVEAGTIDIAAKKSQLVDASINGGVCNKELQEVLAITKPFGSKMKALSDSMRAFYQAHKMAELQALQQTAVSLESDEKKALEKHVKEHPKSYASAYLAYQLNSYDTNLDSAEAAYNNIDTIVKESYYAKKLKGIIDALKSTAVGTLAPNFTSTDGQGQPISLASFKGKYVLVDFWASWCGPCRQENPNVLKAYQQFKNKNFTVLGYSLDENKDAWQQAIKNDKLSWTQVSDLKGWSSTTAAMYNVQSIPANYLLDPSGKIIAKDLHGEDLIAALTSVLK